MYYDVTLSQRLQHSWDNLKLGRNMYKIEPNKSEPICWTPSAEPVQHIGTINRAKKIQYVCSDWITGQVDKNLKCHFTSCSFHRSVFQKKFFTRKKRALFNTKLARRRVSLDWSSGMTFLKGPSFMALYLLPNSEKFPYGATTFSFEIK